jgi:YfiH family protein
VCEPLEAFAPHFFTTRAWRLGERTASAEDGWQQVAAEAGVGVEQLRRLHQVHGCDVAIFKKGDAALTQAPKADIALTDDSALAIAVQTADCLPLLIVDRRTGTVAAAHAGWRGVAAGVPAQAVVRMGGRIEDLLVAVGPAIGACCYEVGADVRSRLMDNGLSRNQADRWFHGEPIARGTNVPMPTLGNSRRSDRWFFDMWTCVRDQLEDVGVRRDHIFIAELCTATHEEWFCSYRRDGAIAGRMAAVIRPGPSPR